MKILYFTRGQSPHDLRFTSALAKTQHSVAVLCLEKGSQRKWPDGIKEISWKGISRPFTWLDVPRFAKQLQKVIAEYQPDVIHAGPIQQTAFISAYAGIKPLVSMSWGSDLLVDADKSPIGRCVTRFTLKRTTLLAADCQTVVDKANEFGYSGPARIFPWGVDLEHFHPGEKGNLRSELGWEDACVFLSNRTMEKLYGVDVVVKAFAIAARKNKKIRLLLFGKGKQEQEIRFILADAGVENRVHFGGFADLADLPDIYRSADYYVSASHSDGSSVSLMEALACGIPAIVSDIPSNKEWITPEKQGWLFADGDWDELSETMLKAADQKERDTLSRNARILAEKQADWQKNFSVLLKSYQDAFDLNENEKIKGK